MDEAGQGSETRLGLALSEDGRKLLATWTPDEAAVAFDRPAFESAIAEQGFGQLFPLDSAIQQFLRQCAGAKEAFTLEIAEARDAQVKVEVASDRMAAYLSASAARGGQSLSREQIQQALAEKGVSHGLLDEAIEQAVVAGEVQRLQVAQGRKPVNGEDARLEPLVEVAPQRRPYLDDSGRAHYRDLGGVISVFEGDRLMQRIPPTPGEAGVNVLGQAIPAKPGKDCQFSPQLAGTRIDPAEPNVLLAAITGQPVLVANGMTVEPNVTLKSVDLGTGNVNFEGTVVVSGDVAPGMSVYASGDIHVGGTVEAASLVAGGHVVVKGGIIGHAEGREAKAAGKELNARVQCGGTCSALFIENASIEAGDSIQVERLVMQSELAAGNQIVVGQPGSGRGSLIGGFSRATLMVHAGIIGAPAGVKTRVMVGTNPTLYEKQKQLDQTLAQKAKELEDVGRILGFIAENPGRVKPDIQQKAQNTQASLNQELAELNQAKADLEQGLALAEGAKVEVEKTVFSSVQIEIGGKIKLVDVERGAGAYVLKEGEIEFL